MTAGSIQYSKNPDSEQGMRSLVVVCADNRSVESVSDFVLQQGHVVNQAWLDVLCRNQETALREV